MLINYIALVRKEKKSDYGVDFPDFPGCVTAGKTLEEARQMAQEALEFHVQGMMEDGDALPEPRPVETIMLDSENTDAVAFLVAVPTEKSKAKRINVTFPEPVLKEVDAYVKSHPGQNRSRVLVTAVQKLIEADAKKTSKKKPSRKVPRPRTRKRKTA